MGEIAMYIKEDAQGTSPAPWVFHWVILLLAAIVLVETALICYIAIRKPSTQKPSTQKEEAEVEEMKYFTTAEGRKIHVSLACSHLLNSSKIRTWHACADCARDMRVRVKQL